MTVRSATYLEIRGSSFVEQGSFEEIIEGKAHRREELMSALRSADPTDLAKAAEHLREGCITGAPANGAAGLAHQPSASNRPIIQF
tara:strand:+ start:37 stop:294 length:258 start_codon:yes stop_codon:yes gene_type:complete